MTVALYPGSFDPPTNGHLEVIGTASEIFEKLIVCIGVNPLKEGRFSRDDRIRMLRAISAQYPNVDVVTYDRFTVEFAKEVGASVMVRGIRNVSDYEYERGLEEVNRKMVPAIKTVFLFPSSETSFTSSSLVKGLENRDPEWKEWVRQFLPPYVFYRLSETCNEIESRWQELGTIIFGNEGAKHEAVTRFMDHWGEKVISAYTSRGGTYHNDQHILDLLDLLEEFIFDGSVEDIEVRRIEIMQMIAIWFHDVVYKFGAPKGENETASSLMATEFVMAISELMIAHPEIEEHCIFGSKMAEVAKGISTMIEATEHDVIKRPTWEAAKLVADIDVASFALDSRDTLYKKTNRIRDEFHSSQGSSYGREGYNTLDELFWRGRQGFLHEFRSRDPIYQSDVFLERYPDADAKARAALSVLIEWCDDCIDGVVQKNSGGL